VVFHSTLKDAGTGEMFFGSSFQAEILYPIDVYELIVCLLFEVTQKNPRANVVTKKEKKKNCFASFGEVL